MYTHGQPIKDLLLGSPSVGWMPCCLYAFARWMDAFLHVRAKCLDAFAGAGWLGALLRCGVVAALVVVLVVLVVARGGALCIWSMVMVLV